MNAPDVLWTLFATGVLDAPRLDRACTVLDVSRSDLQAARARYECPDVPAPPQVPVTAVSSTPVPSVGPSAMSRAFVPEKRWRWTEAGRRREADRIFATLRVEQPTCDLCGQPIQSGEVVVIDRAHHEFCKVSR